MTTTLAILGENRFGICYYGPYDFGWGIIPRTTGMAVFYIMMEELLLIIIAGLILINMTIVK
jgi:hypothetical protein